MSSERETKGAIFKCLKELRERKNDTGLEYQVVADSRCCTTRENDEFLRGADFSSYPANL